MAIFFPAVMAGAVAAALVIVFATNASWLAKLVGVALAAGSIACQTHPRLRAEVHFLLPLFVQIGLILWGSYALKHDSGRPERARGIDAFAPRPPDRD